MTKPVVILGGGGDGRVAAQLISHIFQADNSLQVAGFLDDRLEKGSRINDAKVLDGLEGWSKLPLDILFFPALHKVKQMVQRAKRIHSLGIPKDRWATLCHPTACIADNVRIGVGSMIGSHVTIQPNAAIGRFVSIRAGASLGHDAIVEDFAYIGPNVSVSGNVHIEQGAHIGPNASIIDACTVGSYSVVGLGSAVTKNVGQRALCMGNPARKIRTLTDAEAF
jgi:sugar O-acyltransferase (sialic acid O-acetyltransferase NeuD family)